MMQKMLMWVVVLALIIIGGWWLMQDDRSADLGSYAYVCDNGAEFTMSPSSDMSSIELSAGSQGMFTGTVTLTKMGDGAHYETTTGTLITFGGTGEEVQLTVGGERAVCNPVPSTESPPWNWGDAGEGGGVKQDVSLVVSESIVGKWESADDVKFGREFRDGGVVIDTYEGTTATTGQWKVYTKENPLPTTFPLEGGSVYLQIVMPGSQADTLNFKLAKLTPEELELIYMERGGVLKFKAIK